MTKPSVAIVGCGKLGTALARRLAACGYPLAALASKRLSSARTLAARVRAESVSDRAWEVLTAARVVFLTTPDGVIQDACEQIAGEGGWRPDTLVYHCSGAHSSALLAPARAAGAVVGSLHPLQSFASTAIKGNPFDGIVMSVEGDEQAVKTGHAIAEDLGATCFTIRTDTKTLYHASAVVASNYLVTLLEFAFRLIEAAGIDRRDAFGVLKPLIDGTLANVEAVGIPEALTGPVARGDVATVGAHLDAIAAQAPDLESLYKLLGRHTVAVATAKGALGEEQARAIGRLVEDKSSGG